MSSNSNSNREEREERFVQFVSQAQPGLYAYIYRLVPDTHAARDLLGETNLVLWRKRDRFQPESSFSAWAMQIAYFEVKNYRRRQQRERLLFDDTMMQLLADETGDEIEFQEEMLRALDDCVGKHSEKDRDLLQQRYHRERSVDDIAAAVGRTAHAISQALYRIRMSLQECIEQALVSPKDR